MLASSGAGAQHKKPVLMKSYDGSKTVWGVTSHVCGFQEKLVRSKLSLCAIVGVVSLAGIQAAAADTYKLPIRNGDTILKIYVDSGKARRVDYNDGIMHFEVDMDQGKCTQRVRLVFSDATNLDVSYNVCSEKGFGLTRQTHRF